MRRKKQKAEPFGSTIQKSVDAFLVQLIENAESDCPSLAHATRYGYRGIASPIEQAVIEAMRLAKRCGRGAPWTAERLNNRGIANRGRPWTARAVLRVLERYPDKKGTAEAGQSPEAAFKRLLDIPEQAPALSDEGSGAR